MPRASSAEVQTADTQPWQGVAAAVDALGAGGHDVLEHLRDVAADHRLGQGHTQLGEPCALGILRRFLQAGSTADLDTACVAQVRQPPFFLNFNGSAP